MQVCEPSLMLSRLLPAVVCLSALSACGGRGASPAAHESAEASVFAYLLERYDRDGSGEITPEEYEPGEVAFRRLDRKSDGKLTPADFAPRGRRVPALSPQEGRRLRTLFSLCRFLQDDEDPLVLTWSEIENAFSAYDRNGDERVGRTEFEGIMDERAALGRAPAGRRSGLLEVETTDPWEALLGGLDGDLNGFMTPVELESFFRAQTASDRLRFRAEELALPERTLIGRKAPDFTLPRAEGIGTVTLSRFAGSKPVALIFGSYT